MLSELHNHQLYLHRDKILIISPFTPTPPHPTSPLSCDGTPIPSFIPITKWSHTVTNFKPSNNSLADTRRNDNVIITSKRRRDVVLTS